MNNVIYKSKFPSFAVRDTGGRPLGRCYVEYTFEVRSDRPVPNDVFDSLFSAGFFACGQDFSHSLLREDAELINAVEVNSLDEVVSENPVNPYSGRPYSQHSKKFYVYHVVVRCDSGD
jgi:hypothetical protein